MSFYGASPRVISSAPPQGVGFALPYESPIRSSPRGPSATPRSMTGMPRRTGSYASYATATSSPRSPRATAERPSTAARFLPSPRPQYSPRGQALASTSSGSTRVKLLSASSNDRARALQGTRSSTLRLQRQVEAQRNEELIRQIRSEAAALDAEEGVPPTDDPAGEQRTPPPSGARLPLCTTHCTQTVCFARQPAIVSQDLRVYAYLRTDIGSDAAKELRDVVASHQSSTAVSQLGVASAQAQNYGLEESLGAAAMQPGQPYFSPLRRTLSGTVALQPKTSAVDSYLSSSQPQPQPEPEPELEPTSPTAASAPPAPLRDQWLVAIDSARDIKHLDSSAKADRLLGLQKRAWEQASSLSQVIASPKPSEEEAAPPPPEDRFAKLDDSDRKAVESLGWTAETFNEGKGPTDAWETLSEMQRMNAMMLGYDDTAWDQAVQEEKEEEEERQAEIEAGDPAERQARAAKDVDLFLMELTGGLHSTSTSSSSPR